MTIAPRWKKLVRDFDAIGGRIAMMVAAIAVGVFAVSAIVSAYAILTREISRNYLDTNPASALIDLGAVEEASLKAAREFPGIAAAEAGTIATARFRQESGEWARMLVFVVPDFQAWTIGRAFPEQGAFPPAPGTMAVERESLKFLGLGVGDRLRVQLPTGPKMDIAISATLHDPALAPSWQEQTVYAYVTPETFAAMGGDPVPELLKVVVDDAVFDQQKVDDTVTALARALKADGRQVHQVQIPPAGRHPHQSQMTTVLTMFILFAALALVLSAVLTASMIDGLLAQQIRQIAVMKAIGARYGQVAGLYAAGILAIGAAAVLMGLPLGIYAGRAFADVIAELLNFTIASYRVFPSIVLALIAGGLATPLLFAMVPINKATRRTVRESLSDYGVSRREFGTGVVDRALASFKGIDRTLVLAIRNAFRRRGRLLLTLTLLGAAGAMFIASLSVGNAWDYFVRQSSVERTYDLELQLAGYVPVDKTIGLVSSVEGVERVEAWNHEMVSAARPDGLTVARTYPDGGHASLTLNSMPRADSLAHLVLLDGRLPDPAAGYEVLINQTARFLLGQPAPGDAIELDAEGTRASFRIAGVVRQIVTLPTVFAAPSGFAAISGRPGQTNALRIVMASHRPEDISRVAGAVEKKLEENGVRVVLSTSETQLDSAVGGHVRILVVSLIVMSVLMAVVGLLGLASAHGSNVTERTREFGIMRAIGGTSRVVIRNVIAEGVFIGVVSIAFSIVAALPLAWAIGALVGTMSFGLALPLMLSWTAISLWCLFIVIGGIGASLVPSLTASRLTIRQTLAYA